MHVCVVRVCVCVRACACVCVCGLTLRAVITSHVKGMRNNQIRQFYSFSVSLYNTNRQYIECGGFSNTACNEHLPKKTTLTWY